MRHDHVLKKLNFDLLTPSPRVVGGGGGFCVQINVVPFPASDWGHEVGSEGRIFATMLLNFVIPFPLVCKMTTF